MLHETVTVTTQWLRLVRGASWDCHELPQTLAEILWILWSPASNRFVLHVGIDEPPPGPMIGGFDCVLHCLHLLGQLFLARRWLRVERVLDGTATLTSQ